MARVSVATDDFNRANGTLGSNWLDLNELNSRLRIVSNAVHDLDAGGGASRWNGAGSFNTDQYSKITLVGISAGDADQLGVLLNASTDTDSARDYYYAWVELTSPIKYAVGVRVNGAFTSLKGLTTNSSFAAGDTFSAEYASASTSILLYRNDVLFDTVTGANQLSGGSPGIFSSVSTDIARIDDWEGGNVTAGSSILRQMLMQH